MLPHVTFSDGNDAFQIPSIRSMSFTRLEVVSSSTWAPSFDSCSTVSVSSRLSTESLIESPLHKEEVESILRGDDLSAIILLIRYWPYATKDLLHYTLRGRERPFLDALLVKAGVGSQKAVSGLGEDEMVKQLEQAPQPPTWQPCFQPRQTIGRSSDEIAAIISEHVYQRFRAIPFEDLVRHARGHSVNSIEDFILDHAHILPSMISNHLLMFPQQIQRYCAAAHTLRAGDPFAHLALLRGVQRHIRPSEQLEHMFGQSTLHNSNEDLWFSKAYDSIVAPLRLMLHDPSQSLEQQLKRLAVLAVRFELWIPEDIEKGWDFSTDTRLAECLAEKPPQQVAKLVTERDVARFRKLSLQAIINNDADFQDIGRDWNNLAIAVQECALVDPQFIKRGLNIARHLYTLRNFNALHAVIQGLRNATSGSVVVPQHLHHFTLPDKNYAISCKAVGQGGCLPYIFPFVRAFKRRGQVALVEPFTAINLYSDGSLILRSADTNYKPVEKNLLARWKKMLARIA